MNHEPSFRNPPTKKEVLDGLTTAEGDDLIHWITQADFFEVDEAKPLLRIHLESEDVDIKLAAADALGTMYDHEATPKMKELLAKETDPVVAKALAYNLGLLRKSPFDLSQSDL